jgi:hypothetical protein
LTPDLASQIYFFTCNFLNTPLRLVLSEYIAILSFRKAAIFFTTGERARRLVWQEFKVIY